jgi:rfaE bifunctional protein kinase chain/domain
VEKSTINKIFGQFSQMQAVVIGDAMIDTYLWGKVERMSPEVPVPVVSVVNRESRLGGAGNVSLNLKMLGATPFLFSVIGDDDKGRKFLKILSREGISTEGIFVDSSRVTTVKNRIISKGQHIIRVDEESLEDINPGLEDKIVQALEKLISEKKIDLIIFADYDKGVITPSLFERINAIALQNKILTAVDPKRSNFGMYNNITLFKPNFMEFTEGAGVQCTHSDFEAIGNKSLKIRHERNMDVVFVTLSEQGVYVSYGENGEHFPANLRQIADVSGAGDTVISVAALSLAAGLSAHVMAVTANLAGGLVCEIPGVAPVNMEQLKSEMLTL